MIDFILLDIEGTTTSIDFVHDTLFPYASDHMAEYVRAHGFDTRVQTQLEAVKKTVREEEGKEIDEEGAIQALLHWISQDRKHPALKNLQGYLWREGYETRQYQGHLYDDVVPVLDRWREEGKRLGVYSSGSVEAQKLLFGYSEQGDLRDYFSAHFDTQVGHKREKAAYERIAEQLDSPPHRILFLSDVPAELDAAKAAGMVTCQLVRPGTVATDQHPTAPDFAVVHEWLRRRE